MEEVSVEVALAGPNHQELDWGRRPTTMRSVDDVSTWANTTDVLWHHAQTGSAREICALLLFSEEQYLGAIDLTHTVQADAYTTVEMKTGALLVTDHQFSRCLSALAELGGRDYSSDFKKLQKQLSKRVRRGRLW